MLRRYSVAALCCLISVLWICPGPASATERAEPVKITLVGEPQPAQAEREYQSTLRVRIAPGVSVTGLHLTGSGWRVESMDLDPQAATRAAAPSAAGEREILIPFRAVPRNPEAVLVLEYTWNGNPAQKLLDLSPEAYARTLPQRSLAHRPGQRPEFSTLESDPAPIPPAMQDPSKNYPAWRDLGGAAADNAQASLETGAAQAPEPAPAGRYITVTGRLICRHEMQDIVPASFEKVTVLVSDGSGTYPGNLAHGDADQDGYFSVEVYWHFPPDPDIQVRYYATNEAVIVQSADVWESTWDWYTDTWEDVSTATLDVGELEPTTPNGHGAMYIAETVARCRDFISWDRGLLTPQVDCQFPDSGGSVYSNYWQEIHIDPADKWLEETVLHEFGHHFHQAGFGYYHDHTGEIDYYCDGYCDDEIEYWFDDCGHCIWCEENDRVAWNEALPYFFSRYWTNALENLYDNPPQLNHADVDVIALNGLTVCPGQQDPELTEGYLAAVLWDLCDGNESDHDDPEYHPNNPILWQDETSGYADEVFAAIDNTCDIYDRRPHYAYELLYCFIHSHEFDKNNIWETYAHNNIQLDVGPCANPTAFQYSPPINDLTPDNTVVIQWTAPEDDMSGLGGYAVSWSALAPADPGTDIDIQRWQTKAESSPLAPAEWYFNIRTVDRAGNWNPGYASVGPFRIRAADPVNLEPSVHAGWDYALVPRNDDTALANDAQVSNALNGNLDNTYWSAAITNSGDDPTVASSVALYLDHETNIVDSFNTYVLNGGVGYNQRNRGPVTVPGGRHVLGMLADADGTNAESAEWDNYWAKAFVWYPQILSTSSTLMEPAPPNVWDGSDYYDWSYTWYPPCKGYRLSPAFWFSAVTMFVLGTDVDYDLALYDKTYSAETGFDTPLALSGRVANTLEAVLVNVPVTPYQDYFIGARNEAFRWDPTGPSYKIRGVRGQTIGSTYGAYSNTLTTESMLDLYNFSVDPATGGSLTLTLSTPDYSGKVYMGYFDPTFSVGTLTDASPIVVATYGDSATISVPGPFSEVAAVAVWREPWDSNLGGGRNYTLRFRASPPDPGTYADANWDFPIVPKPNPVLSPYTYMTAPTALTGGLITYTYGMERNFSPADAPTHDLVTLFDGDSLLTNYSPTSLPGDTDHAFYVGAWVVEGGRHTLGLEVDYSESLEEILETNNATARQWVWSPEELAWNTSQYINLDVDPLGGWDAVPAEYPAYYNCLGFRMGGVSPRNYPFTVAFLANNGTADGDLRLHLTSTGPEHGFDSPLAVSGHSRGQADYIIVNTSATFGGQRDIGVVGISGGGGMYLEADTCLTAEITAPGTYGPFVLAGGDYVQIHQLGLPPDLNYHFRVTPDRGDVAVSLHEMNGAYSSRSDALDLADDGVSGAEEFSEPILRADPHVLAVWRPRTRDDHLAIAYTIEITQPYIGVGDDPLPAELRLAARPNPFAAGTEFRVETRSEGALRVVIYDVQGSVVRRMDQGVAPAGETLIAWDGRDHRGTPVPGGVYFARVESADGSRAIKIVRME